MYFILFSKKTCILIKIFTYFLHVCWSFWVNFCFHFLILCILKVNERWFFPQFQVHLGRLHKKGIFQQEKSMFFWLKKTTYLFYVYSETCSRGTGSPNIMLLGLLYLTKQGIWEQSNSQPTASFCLSWSLWWQ